MALRFNDGKTKLHYLPPEALAMIADVFSYGAAPKEEGGKGYGTGNWMSPPYFSKEVLINCMKRHIAKMEMGEEIDDESGLYHVGHLGCNMSMYAFYLKYNLFTAGDIDIQNEKRRLAEEYARLAAVKESARISKLLDEMSDRDAMKNMEADYMEKTKKELADSIWHAWNTGEGWTGDK